MINLNTERVALVTGGSRGIGRAISQRLAQDGFTVGIVFRLRLDEAETTRDEIVLRGGKCWIHQADVADQEQVRILFERVRKEHGHLDLLVNNAGQAHEAVFALTPPQKFVDQMQVNFMSAVMCSQAAVRLMVRRRSGVIINISSASATRSPVGLSAYAASKAALESLTRTMARELISSGIRVNGVAPSWTETDMTATRLLNFGKLAEGTMLGRPLKTDEVAGVVSTLARDDMATLSGQILRFEGGT